jgi:hypothetical protein
MATRADGFWAAKLLADFSDADIRAAVKAGEYENAEDAEAIIKTLIERRDIIVRYWFSRSSPLDQFEISGGKLSFKDLAVEKGFEPKGGTIYRAEVFSQEKKGKKLGELESREPSITLDPSWAAAGSGVKVILRALRPSSQKPGPAVEVLLNAMAFKGSATKIDRHTDRFIKDRLEKDPTVMRQHQELAAGRWRQLSFMEQMANVGSEVERALNWRSKNNPVYCERARDRAFELLDLTLENAATPSRLRELSKVREAMTDYFLGENQFGSTEGSWRKYFSGFAYAARKDR